MPQSGKYFYRCHSNSSAGALISGKARGHNQRLATNLRAQFNSHVRHPSRKQPTALVSTSSRLIDTLQRAFSKFYNGPNQEDASKIWIAFMYVPDVDRHVYHHAEDLAKQYGHTEPWILHYEYLFEWEIPERYLVHEVSVKTLINRGFDMTCYLDDNSKIPKTSDLRREFTSTMLSPWQYPDIIGIELGLMVRAFGARAPVRQLARQLLHDCYHVRRIDEGCQVIVISYEDGEIGLDFEYFCDIEEGIDMALMDWWLADLDFYDAYNRYCDWASEIENEDVIEGEAIRLGL
jgi:hypothetical protein